jgi:hypothetical protein
MLHNAEIEQRPNDLATRHNCVGLELSSKSRTNWLLARGLIARVLKKELYDARNREVV